jgi:hypothetical protein
MDPKQSSFDTNLRMGGEATQPKELLLFTLVHVPETSARKAIFLRRADRR